MPVPFRWRNIRLDGGGYFQRIICHPTVRDRVVAGCDIAGFYLWSETTKSWSLIGDFTYQQRNYWGAGSFAWHPTDGNTFWFAAGQYVTGTQSLPGGIFKSTDGGLTLTQLTFPLIPFGSNQNQRRLAGERLSVCPNNPNTLLFGVYSSSTAAGKGLYRSSDGGISWAQQDYSAIAPGQTVPAINDTNGTVFTCWDTGASATAGLCFAGIFGVGVSKSTDGGLTWSFISGPKYLMKAVCINGTLYTTSMQSAVNDLPDLGDALSGITKYEHATNTWTNINNSNSLPQGTPLAILGVNPLNPQQIVTGHAYLKAFYLTNNGGASWAKVSEISLFQTVPYQDAALVVATEGIGDFQFDPVVSNRAWFGNFYYVTRTTNFNNIAPTWITYGKGIENTVPFDLLIPKGSGDMLLSGWFDIEGFRQTSFDTIPRNKFGGIAANDSSIYRNFCCVSVAACPAQPSLCLRVSSDYTAIVADVVKSNDYGITWTKVTSVSSPQRIACSVTDPNTWVVLRLGLPPAYTTNGGGSWTVLSGMPSFLSYVFNYSMPLVADASDGNIFYLMDDNVSNNGAGTYGNLYKLTKSGATITSQIISASKLPLTYDGSKTSTLRTIPGEIWGAFYDQGIWKSVNGGVNWVKVSTVNEASTLCFGAADTNNGFSVPTLYFYGAIAGNSDYGVWMSRDKGVTWQLTTDSDARKRGMHNFQTQMCASQDTFGLVIQGTNGHGAFYGLANPVEDVVTENNSIGSPVTIVFAPKN